MLDNTQAEGEGMGKRHGEATVQGECLGRHFFLKKICNYVIQEQGIISVARELF